MMKKLATPLKKSDICEWDVDDGHFSMNSKKLYSPQQIYKSKEVNYEEIKPYEIDKLIKDLTEGSPNQKYYNNILKDNVINTIKCEQYDLKPINPSPDHPKKNALRQKFMEGANETTIIPRQSNDIVVIPCKRMSNLNKPYKMKLEKVNKTMTYSKASAVSESKLYKIEFLSSVPQRNITKKITQNTQYSGFTKSTNWAESPELIDPGILTNRQDIPDFYEYIEECLKLVCKLKAPSIDEIKHLQVDLPYSGNKKVAVFDLDETLVHCVTDKNEQSDVKVKIKLPHGKYTEVGLNIRPLIKDALAEIANDYICVAYTASEKCYADKVIDFIDPDETIFKQRLYRHNCIKVEYDSTTFYVKDLRIFKNVDLKNIIIIDNSVLSFAFQLDNGIPILPYYEGNQDCEMKFLVKYLNHLSTTDDIRVENSKLMQLDYLMRKLEERKTNSISKDIEEDKSKYSFSLQLEEDCIKEETGNYKEMVRSIEDNGEKLIVFSNDEITASKSVFGFSNQYESKRSDSNNFTLKSSYESMDKSVSYVKEDLSCLWNELRSLFK